MNHLPILPVLVPMIGGALSLFVEHRRYGPRVQRAVAWSAMAQTSNMPNTSISQGRRRRTVATVSV